MPSYRLYLLDGTGKIATADWIEAADDEAAAAEARKRVGQGTCEVWDRQRLVARVRC